MDVIEHVEDPEAVLMEVSRKLKPGGWLMLETGNFNSFDRVDAGSDWWCYNSEHYWFLTPEIIQQLLQKCGFDKAVFADRVLRPNVTQYSGAPTRYYVKQGILHPRKAVEHLRKAVAMSRARTGRRIHCPVWVSLRWSLSESDLPCGLCRAKSGGTAQQCGSRSASRYIRRDPVLRAPRTCVEATLALY